MSIQALKAGQQYASSGNQAQQAAAQQRGQVGEANQQTAQVQNSDEAGRHEGKVVERTNEALSELEAANREVKYAEYQNTLAAVNNVTQVASAGFDVAVKFFS